MFGYCTKFCNHLAEEGLTTVGQASDVMTALT